VADKKSEAVMVRLDETDQETLLRLAQETGIRPATLARMALQAVLKDYRITRRITLPLTMRLASDYSQTRLGESLLNEPSALEESSARPPGALAKKKTPPAKAGRAGAGAALPGSKPNSEGETSAGA
jgi:hypothetical protein